MLSNLKGTKIHKMYKRNDSIANFHYSEIHFKNIDNLIELQHPLYVDIVSTEVWVYSTIIINNTFTTTTITSSHTVRFIIHFGLLVMARIQGKWT